MNKLNERTRYYTNLISRCGVDAEKEEVYGILAVKTLEAIRAYERGIEHCASLDTYIEQVCRNEMLRYLRSELKRQCMELPRGAIETAGYDDTQTALKLHDVLASLSDIELLYLAELLSPSAKVNKTMSAYGARRKTRETAIGKTADAVAKVYGLNVRRVRYEMKEVRVKMEVGLA